MKSRPIHTSGLDPIRQIPIRDVASRLGIQIGRGNSLRCPFPDHNDRNPSFSLFPGTNSCRCFGCDRGGSVIDFVAISQKWSIREAIRWLRTNYGLSEGRTQVRRLIPLRRIGPADEATSTPENSPQFLPNAEIYEAMLSEHPIRGEASAYLTARGFSARTIAHFRLGFLLDASQAAGRLCQKFGHDAVYKAGLLSRNAPTAALTLSGRSVLFPFLEAGNVSYLQGRLLPGAYGPRWLGLRGIRKPIYNRDALSHGKVVHVCEGATDVLAAYEMNLHAVGVTGADARLPRDVLIAMKGKLVCIVPDADGAGRRMGKKLTEQLRAFGVQSITKTPLIGKDLNEYLLFSRRRR